MTVFTFLFYFFELLAAASAFSILFTKNVLHAALLLIICLLSLAGLYVMVHAEFLGMTQILMYAGGVLILIVFGIMLTKKITHKSQEPGSNNLFIGISIGAAFFFILVYSFQFITLPVVVQPSDADQQHHIQKIGVLLMSDYVAPFELVGILLLISLVGAAVIASFTKTGKHGAH